MTWHKDLRPYQLRALEFWRARKDKRIILEAAPGSGKTFTALAAAQALKATSALIIAPARARPTWVDEAKRWLGVELGSITNRPTTPLPKAKAVRLAAAYESPFQVVSYNLAGNLTAEPRDLIILDECHRLANPQSGQSAVVEALLAANPRAPVLALTGTLVRKEVQDVWNQVHLLWPNYLGKPTKAGDVSFDFRREYCDSAPNEYSPSGRIFFGARAEKLPALRAKLADRVFHIGESDILEFLPKLTAKALYVDDGAKLHTVVTDWAEQAVADFTHVGVITYHREVARDLHARLQRAHGRTHTMFYVDGTLPVERRAALLEAARKTERCVFVGTSEAIGESVSLTFLRTALVCEWRTAPAQAVQLLGRFVRAEANALPAYINYVVFPQDTARARTLFERTQVVEALVTRDAKTEVLSEIMAPRPLTDERLQQLAKGMLGEIRLSLLEADDDDDE